MTTTMNLPANAIESAASYLWLDEDGLIIIINKPTALHTKADAEEGITLTYKVAGEIARPLLIDITDVRSMSREARELYANASIASKVKAVGLVTRSTMGRIVGNFFLGFNKPSVPVKLFKNHKAAKKWLMNFT